MKYLFWLLKAAIFLFLFVFAIHNRHDAAMHFLFGYTVTLPVTVIVLCSFTVGAIAGIAVMLPRCWRYKKEARQAQVSLSKNAEPTSNINAPTGIINPTEMERHMTDPSITITNQS